MGKVLDAFLAVAVVAGGLAATVLSAAPAGAAVPAGSPTTW